MTLVCSKKCWQIFDCSGRLCPNDSLSGLIAVSSALQLSGVILFGGQPLIAPLEARGASNSILVSQLEQSLTHASRITLPIRIRIHLYNLVTTCTWSFHRISAPLVRLLNCQLSGKVQRFPLLFVPQQHLPEARGKLCALQVFQFRRRCLNIYLPLTLSVLVQRFFCHGRWDVLAFCQRPTKSASGSQIHTAELFYLSFATLCCRRD